MKRDMLFLAIVVAWALYILFVITVAIIDNFLPPGTVPVVQILWTGLNLLAVVTFVFFVYIAVFVKDKRGE